MTLSANIIAIPVPVGVNLASLTLRVWECGQGFSLVAHEADGWKPWFLNRPLSSARFPGALEYLLTTYARMSVSQASAVATAVRAAL